MARLILYSLDSDISFDAVIVSEEQRISLARAYATAENKEDDVSLVLHYITKDAGAKLAKFLLQPYVFSMLVFNDSILFDVPAMVTTLETEKGTFSITIGLHQG